MRTLLRQRLPGREAEEQQERRRPRHWPATLVLCASALRAEAQEPYEFRELHMGMEVRVVLHAVDQAHARVAARAAFGRIAELEEIMSDWRPESEVRRLERRPGELVAVSQELFDVLTRATEIARATDGAFDPTVGPLVGLWREAQRSGRIPSKARLDSASALVGWRLVAFDTAQRRVRLAIPGMRLDLGGIAKGYIVQQALRALEARGVGSALVEAGGDIAVSDAPPGSPGWRIEVPTADSAVRRRSESLANVVIATSGPSVQYLEIDGRRYSHVVDPRTGLGSTRASHATVIAADGALADALATALTLLGAGAKARLEADYRGVTASVW